MRLLPGGGPAADGVINLVYGLGRRRSATPRSRARDLAGVHFTGSTGVFNGMWKTIGDEHRAATATIRASSARRAARTSSSRTRPPTSTRSRRRSCAARSSTRGRSARPPRASTRRRTSGRSCASGSPSEVGDDPDGRRRRLLELHGRRDRRELVQDAAARRSRRRAATRRRRSSSAAACDDSEGYFVEPTVIETTRPGLPAAARRALRPGRDDVRLPRGRVGARRSSWSTARRRTG